MAVVRLVEPEPIAHHCACVHRRPALRGPTGGPLASFVRCREIFVVTRAEMTYYFVSAANRTRVRVKNRRKKATKSTRPKAGASISRPAPISIGLMPCVCPRSDSTRRRPGSNCRRFSERRHGHCSKSSWRRQLAKPVRRVVDRGFPAGTQWT
jgi:hypothetical protein